MMMRRNNRKHFESSCAMACAAVPKPECLSAAKVCMHLVARLSHTNRSNQDMNVLMFCAETSAKIKNGKKTAGEKSDYYHFALASIIIIMVLVRTSATGDSVNPSTAAICESHSNGKDIQRATEMWSQFCSPASSSGTNCVDAPTARHKFNYNILAIICVRWIIFRQDVNLSLALTSLCQPYYVT